MVRALLDLIAAGDLRPTARRIAERAGISLRSVYVHFDDLEDLFLAAAHEQTLLVADLAHRVPPTGPLSERVAAYVKQRCAVLEAVAPVQRAAGLQEPFSPTLSRLLDFARRMAREDLSRVFEPELAPLDPLLRRRRLATLDAIASSSTWRALRVASCLDEDEAALAVAEAITAQLDRGQGGSARPL